jgi:hypothetical protein
MVYFKVMSVSGKQIGKGMVVGFYLTVPDRVVRRDSFSIQKRVL